MRKNAIFLFLSCSLFCVLQNSMAETCPTVDDLEHNLFDGWQAFDSDNGEPLSTDQMAYYQSGLDRFAEADYYEGAPEGAAQCYYVSAYDPYYGYAYLAKQGLKPDFQQKSWQWAGAYHALCNNVAQAACLFLPAQGLRNPR